MLTPLLKEVPEYFLSTPGAPIQLLVCLIVFVVFYLVSRLLRYKLGPWFIKKAENRNKTGLSILLRGLMRPAPIFVWSLGLYFSLCMLPVPPALLALMHPWMDKLMRITSIALLAWGLIGASDVGPLMLHRFNSSQFGVDDTVINFVNRLLKGTVGVFAVLMILEEMGAPVASLITSLGIVGLTISLAAKDYATNFMGGIILIFEKPFAIGDWIQTSAGEGAVEDISFRSTVIRTIEDSRLTIPNHLLVENPVTNFSRIERRLAKFTLGVTYDATRAQLETLLASIRESLSKRNDVWPDSIRVQLTGFGDSSIDILVQFNVKTGQLPEFLKIREQINLDLMDLVYAAGCSFAFPSTSVYIEKK